MFWILTNIQNICCFKFDAIFLHNISLDVTPERRFCDIQIFIITNFVVVSNVGIKRVDSIWLYL